MARHAGCIFPIDPRVLRAGENILLSASLENPSFSDTPVQSSPYFIDEYSNIVEFNSEQTARVLFLYLFFGLYHIFLYASRRVERYNLCFGLFAVALFIYCSYELIRFIRLFSIRVWFSGSS